MKRSVKKSVPTGFLAVIVVLIFICGIAAMLISGHKLNLGKITSSSMPVTSNTSSGSSIEGINSAAVAPTAFEEESNLPTDYRLITVLNDDIYKGSLMLVNYMYESHVDGENLINLYENVSSSVGVKDDDMLINNVVLKPLNDFFDGFKKEKGATSILISSSYRSKNDQTKIYKDSVKETGEKSTTYYVARPGFSEHQTGYCFDTALYNDLGEMVELDGDGDFSWLSEHCCDYGFILRYPDNKTNITGIGYEAWHFRYVGVPHAYFITDHKICLEEYISGIKNYTFDNGGLLIDKGDKGRWIVYYTPKLEAFNNTDVPVPVQSDKNSYTISGNNIDGFIVTVDVTKDPSNSMIGKAKTEWICNSAALEIAGFEDYDPEKDSDRFSDSDSDNEDWESDDFWDEDSTTDETLDSRFEYEDYYDGYDDNGYEDGYNGDDYEYD